MISENLDALCGGFGTGDVDLKYRGARGGGVRKGCNYSVLNAPGECA
jgi:hypothetical protein